MPFQKTVIESENRSQVLEKVYTSGLHILSLDSKEEVYDAISKELFNLLGVKHVSIYRANHEVLVKEYTTSQELKSLKPGKKGFTYKSFRNAVPYVLDNSYLWKKHPELKGIGIKTTVKIPLTFELDPVGVLSIDFERTPDIEITEGVMQALQLFASIVTYKIKNIELQQRLSETVQNQKLFMSLASHELKNPLTAVLGYASLVQRQVLKGKEIQPNLMHSLISEINRMTNLIDELLNTRNTEIEKATLIYNKKKCRMSEIIRSTMSNFSLSYPNRAVTFEDRTEGKDWVKADPLKLKQVITNLLVNAAKFSEIDTKIKIILETQDDKVKMSVIDHGIGISQKDSKHILKQFYKAPKVNKEGMGLGLYLSKQVIDNHEGTIQVISKRRKGTTFEITLPKYAV